MTPELREERPEDEAFRYALFRDARLAHERFDHLGAALDDQLTRPQWRGQDASYRAAFPQARFLIVENEARPIGRLVVDPGPPVMTLVDLALVPAWRNRGLGTRLVRDLQAEARALGRPLVLAVVLGNEAAQRLYARLGFVCTAATETHAEMRWTAAQDRGLRAKDR